MIAGVAEKGATKPPRTAEPGSLLSQWWSLGAIAADKRASARHMKVAWVILDRHVAKKGNGRASIRFIQKAVNLSKQIIVRACRELVEWGYFSRVIGKGKRPTEYTPIWLSVHPHFNASSVLPLLNASVPHGVNAKADSVEAVSNESFLRSRLTDGVRKEGTEEATAAPTAPPAGGLQPAAADTAVEPEGFEAIWAAWGRKEKRSQAKATYKKLGPDAELHKTILLASRRWTEAYAAIGREKKFQRYLHTWLAGEGWLEDLPEQFESYKAASKRADSSSCASKSATLGASGLTERTPLGRHTVEITAADLCDESALTLRFKILDGRQIGREFGHRFWLNSEDDEKREEGQRVFHEVRKATKILSPTDTSEFVGKTITVHVKGAGRISYEPALQ